MSENKDMNSIGQAYNNLPDNLQRYLPDAIAVDFQRSFAGTCENMTVVLDTLKQFFGDEAVSGWLTLQSKNLLLQNEAQWGRVLTGSGESDLVLQAELVAGDQCVTIHFEKQAWHLALINVSKSNQANALAIPHFFAVDPQRFPAGGSDERMREISYWVIWQNQPELIDPKQSQLIPVAQCLRAICDTEVPLEPLNKKEDAADA